MRYGSNRFQPSDTTTSDFADWFDELPLWSAPFALMLLEMAPVRAGMSVLDVGAGTGFLAIELAERCGKSSSVVAVDPWAAAAERLRAKAARLGLSNVRVVNEDIVGADLEANWIDLIVSNLGLNNFSDPVAALSACYRCARSGAELVLTTNLVGHMAELYSALEDTLRDHGIPGTLDALRAHIAHRGTRNSIEALLDAAGFRVAEVDETRFHMRFSNGTALIDHHLIRSGFLRDWTELVPEDRVDEVFRSLIERLDRRAARDQGLRLTIPALCVRAIKA